jgi:hypothetical protein
MDTKVGAEVKVERAYQAPSMVSMKEFAGFCKSEYCTAFYALLLDADELLELVNTLAKYKTDPSYVHSSTICSQKLTSLIGKLDGAIALLSYVDPDFTESMSKYIQPHRTALNDARSAIDLELRTIAHEKLKALHASHAIMIQTLLTDLRTCQSDLKDARA